MNPNRQGQVASGMLLSAAGVVFLVLASWVTSHHGGPYRP